MVESCVIDYRNYENLTNGFLDDIALFCIKYHPQTVWKWFLIRISFGYFDKKNPLKMHMPVCLTNPMSAFKCLQCVLQLSFI